MASSASRESMRFLPLVMHYETVILFSYILHGMKDDVTAPGLHFKAIIGLSVSAFFFFYFFAFLLTELSRPASFPPFNAVGNIFYKL